MVPDNDRPAIIDVLDKIKDTPVRRELERLVSELLHTEKELKNQRLALETSEQRRRQRNAVLKGINRIFRKALRWRTEEELGRLCLKVAERVTASQVGFIGELVSSSHMEDIAISDPGWTACRMESPAGHRAAPAEFAVRGIYGRVLLDGKGFFTNDPPAHPDSIGLPAGHPPIDSFLGVPLMHAGRVIGMAAVANRPGGYRDTDLEALEMLAPAIVQALLSKRAEQTLRESEERFRTMADGLPLIVWVLDAEGQLQFVNRTYHEFFGTSESQVLGERWKTLVHPEDTDAVIREFRACLNQRRAYNAQLRVRRADGQWRWVESWAKPRFSASGEYLGFVGTSVDITERRQAEEVLRGYRKKLEAEVKSRTAQIEKQYRKLERMNLFIKQMAQHTIKAMENDRKALSKEIHDSIGGSLAAIKMLLETRLQNTAGTPPDGVLSLEKIVRHLSGAIKESKRISYQMRSMTLDDLGLEAAVSESICNFNEFYPDVRVDLQFRISDADIADDIKTVVYRVVQEALNNIGKHSRATSVNITLAESQDRILLEIKDNGCGFQVSDYLDTNQPLQGYGMHSMKERVEICNGSFTVKSSPGKGAQLSASIPKFIP